MLRIALRGFYPKSLTAFGGPVSITPKTCGFRGPRVNHPKNLRFSGAPCHPEWSEAESNLFVRDPRRSYAPSDPRCARISTSSG